MTLLKDKFTNFFGLVDEEYEDNEQTEQEVPYPSAAPSYQYEADTTLKQAVNEPRREGRFSENIQRAVRESQKKQTNKAQQMQQDSPKVIAINNGGNRTSSGGKKAAVSASGVGKISIVEPRVYSEAMTIAKRIMAGESVLVNFDLLDESQARRIVDFLTGTVYAEDGDIQRVGDEIFLCTPADVEIDSTVAQSLAESNFFE